MTLSTNIDLIAAAVLDAAMPLAQACELIEGRIIDAALLRTGGNVTASATLLGVNRNTVHNKLRARQPEHSVSLCEVRANSRTDKRNARKLQAQFTVDAASVLIQVERELAAQGPAAIGLRFGCREIRRHLHAIGVRALKIKDGVVLEHLQALCVIYPKGDELEGRTV